MLGAGHEVPVRDQVQRLAPHPVELRHWPLLLALAALNLLGQLGLVRAFSLAPPSAIAPYEYTALLWAAALGFLVFGDVPNRWTLAGAGIVIASGLYLLHRERVRRAQ